MKKWKTYHSDINNEKFDCIVIGSGIGVSSVPYSGLLTASAVHGQALYSLLKN